MSKGEKSFPLGTSFIRKSKKNPKMKGSKKMFTSFIESEKDFILRRNEIKRNINKIEMFTLDQEKESLQKLREELIFVEKFIRFKFKEGAMVYYKAKNRMVSARVICYPHAQQYTPSKQVLIKPIDSVYKEEFILPESLLEVSEEGVKENV
jgi:hypothetical protein